MDLSVWMGFSKIMLMIIKSEQKLKFETNLKYVLVMWKLNVSKLLNLKA